jgi:hypothetical protein
LSRLWQGQPWRRFGIFRALSVLVLLCGVLGGAQLTANRAAQERWAAAAAMARTESGELSDLRRLTADQLQASADERRAQRDAQAKADTAAAAAAAQAQAAEDAARRGSGTSRSDTRTFGPIPTSCSQYKGNQAIGCALLLQWGYGLDQMPCLQQLWMKESGWNERASSPSGAYGIPQALPASKMSVYGSDYRTNPATQIKWGLDYVKSRYRTPCAAWTFWLDHHWY